MNPSIHLVIEGDNCLRWVMERKDTGLVDLVFDCNERENIISVTPGLLKNMAEMMSDYLKGNVEIGKSDGQKFVNNSSSKNGKMIPRVDMSIDEDEMAVEVDWECGPEEGNPALTIETKRSGSFSMFMTPKQAKEIAERCLKISTVKALFDDVVKKKIIKAKAR